MNEELVPIDKVIDDMYNPDGGMVAMMARTYYYDHYASPEERKRMDREDKIDTIIAASFWVGYATLLLISIFV